MPDLFQGGDFALSSGIKSDFKIECDSLSDEEVAILCKLLSHRVEPFSEVIGIPRGGVRIANELEKYVSFHGGVLVVDDVWTTGGSLKRFAQDGNSRLHRWTQFAVLFARAPMPPAVTEAGIPAVALFTMSVARPWYA